MSGELVGCAAALGRELKTMADDASFCGCGNCAMRRDEVLRMAREQVDFDPSECCDNCGAQPVMVRDSGGRFCDQACADAYHGLDPREQVES